ncbi:right-handed parallel beta-helix repeat-containing protein [Streptacidiphilus sp. N1-10]|uniref:Right-handed parallel beta-helix repeat-containing protein n=1 Tax=Streptacidiphilus jeojiensis TaxID=3229225 RepID=A0ABV6XWR3_9ACTN
MGGKLRHWAWSAALSATALLTIAGCGGTPDVQVAPTGAPSVGTSAAPTAVPTSEPAGVAPASATPVCDRIPAGPATAPAGAVTVDPAVVGDLVTKTVNSPPHTTFWLLPGTHRLGSGAFDQVVPKDGDVYVGAPGAVLDGQNDNQTAFGGSAADVSIRYLTVQHFAAPQDEGVVNHDSADGWVIEHTTVQDNSGAGLMAGAREQVRSSCLRRNGQYGMNAYKGDGTITGLVLQGDEITGNNTGDWERRQPDCGCSGGVKFWAVNGADITGNWVHDNRGTGLWADTNNNDFLIEDNVIENNDGAALIYEASYNAVIRYNTIRRNELVEGRTAAAGGDDFPYGTVYLSESGGEPRIKARTTRIDIYGNVLTDNWSGITLWENADRFCNSPANTSSGDCTLLVPDVKTCAQPAIAHAPLYSDCRWKTQRVDIHDNRFVQSGSTAGCAGLCGRMAVLSNYGSYPDWSPYKGDPVAQAITFDQQNRWYDNTYSGPWSFVAHDQGVVLNTGQWQAAPYRQDTGSTFGPKAGG